VSLLQAKAQGHDIHRDVLYTKFDRCNEFFGFNAFWIYAIGDRLLHGDLPGNKVPIHPQIPKGANAIRPLWDLLANGIRPLKLIRTGILLTSNPLEG
jgi:hypothetical protein